MPVQDQSEAAAMPVAVVPAPADDRMTLIAEPMVQSLPVALVPTPTEAYRSHRKYNKAVVAAGAPVPTPIPVPLPPPLPGARVLIWKQDPSVAEITVRKAYLPGHVLAGPRDARLMSGIPGIPPVSPNAFGDLIQTPGTDAFDAVQTYAVCRMTLTMYQRALARWWQPGPAALALEQREQYGPASGVPARHPRDDERVLSASHEVPPVRRLHQAGQ